MDIPKKPTLKDVARLANTSVATASVVLNQVPHKNVNNALAERVWQAAKQLSYYPNIPARRMKGKSGKFLAIMVPQFENVYFHRIVIGAENYANSKGYTLSIFSTYDEEMKEIKFIENLISLQVDGILISPAEYRSKTMQMIKDTGIPYVVIDRPINENDYDFVTVDYYQAAFQGTELLIKNGHRQIAYIGWQNNMQSISDRVKGYKEALLQGGLQPDSSLFWEVERSCEVAHKVALEVFRNQQISAIFAGHHQIGEGIIEALRDLGKVVPQDISVLVFGNPVWASITNPRFTCIAQPDLEIGRKAAELIIDQLENPEHKLSQYVMPADLYIRESIRAL